MGRSRSRAGRSACSRGRSTRSSGSSSREPPARTGSIGKGRVGPLRPAEVRAHAHLGRRLARGAAPASGATPGSGCRRRRARPRAGRSGRSERARSCRRRRRRAPSAVCALEASHQVDEPARVAPLVVVPAEDLHDVARHHRQAAVEDARVRRVLDVRRDELVVRVLEDPVERVRRPLPRGTPRSPRRCSSHDRPARPGRRSSRSGSAHGSPSHRPSPAARGSRARSRAPRRSTSG